MTDGARRAEWEHALAERAAARAKLVASLDGLEARARDPFGLKAAYQRNPLLFAGVAAGAGALLAGLLAPGRRTSDAVGASAPRDEPEPFLDGLRDALQRGATPWITRLVEEHLAGPRTEVPDEGPGAPPAA